MPWRPDRPEAPIIAPMSATRTTFLALIIALVIGDLGAKAIARFALRDNDLELTPFLALRLRFNEGSTFGLLPMDSAGWLVALVVIAVICFGWWYARPDGWRIIGPTALVSAGGIGNLADRAFRGNVTDFVAIAFDRWHLPIFNLADVFLVAGVLLLVLLPSKPPV